MHFRRSRSPNLHLKRIIAQGGGSLPFVIYRDKLTDRQALDLEVQLIADLGRVANGGPLVNLTDGGDGTAGYKFTVEQRARLSKAQETHPNKYHALGKKRTPEQVERIRAALFKRAPVSESSRAKMSASSHRDRSPHTLQAKANISAARETMRQNGWRMPSKPCALQTRQKIGTANKGASNGMAKLTSDMAVDIFRSTLATKQIAANYGCSITTVYDIRTGKRWSHVTSAIG